METWLETGQVGDAGEDETQPTQSQSTESPFKSDEPQSATSSKVADVKDAFDDLFNN